MKGVLPLGLLCSFVAVCLAAGTEEQDVSPVGDLRGSSVVSSLLPEPQGSTYLLAFPVDDANSNDNTEQVLTGGGGAPDTVAEETSTADKDEKEDVMTVMINADGPKEEEKNEVIVPLQDLQPKEEPKFFPPPPPPPFIPFRSKPTYRERKFTLPTPFPKLRPALLPPMRNILQSLRREPPSKISPINFLSAASLFRHALGNRLRMLTDRYQSPRMDEKLIPLPPFAPPEPLLPLPRSPMPMLLPPPQTSEPMFMPHISPFQPLFMSDAPPYMPPPMPFHPALLLPPFMHPFPIAPTPFMLPPPPPTFIYHSPPPRRMLPPAMPLFHPPPFMPHRLSPLESPPLPPPFMQRIPQKVTISEFVPSHEPSFMIHQNPEDMHPISHEGPEEDEIVLIPSQEETRSAEEPAYLLLYPNESEMPQYESTSKKKSLMDLLRPQTGKVRHVIQQTRIITQYKPDLTGLFKNRLGSSPFHKPIFRIMDM